MDTLTAAHLTHLRQRNLRPSTIYQRQRVLARATSWAGAGLLEVGHEEIQGYIDARPSPESAATELSHLRSFYRWAVLAGHLEVDPTSRVVRPKTKRRLPRPIGRADLLHALVEAPPRVRPILLLAAWAGLRACEIAQLRVEDIRWDERRIIIRESKGGDETTAALSDHLVAALEMCDLPTSGWLCPRLDGRPGPLAPWRVSQLGNRAMREAGVNATLHQLRHWFGTEVQRAGRDIRKTQEAMRHRSIVSTQGYTLIVNDDVREAVNLIPAPEQRAS